MHDRAGPCRSSTSATASRTAITVLAARIRQRIFQIAQPDRRYTERHREGGLAATVTAVPSPGRFGILDIAASGVVTRFHEKPSNEMGWINGGFFVLEPEVFNYIQSDATV